MVPSCGFDVVFMNVVFAVEDDIGAALSDRMRASLEHFKSLLKGLRTGRAHASLLDGISVDAYGSQMPISQLGSISVPEANMIVVQVWDANLVGATVKAINTSSLGLHAHAEGNVIRMILPDLTQERRKELSKKVNEYAENTKISIRNIRRDAVSCIKDFEKNNEISEDDMHLMLDDIQRVTDRFVSDIDKFASEKRDSIESV